MIVINRKFKALSESEKRQKLRDNGFSFYSYQADGYFLTKPIHYWNGRPTLFLEIYIDGDFEIIRTRFKTSDDKTYNILQPMFGSLYMELSSKSFVIISKLAQANIIYIDRRESSGKHSRKHTD